MEPITLDAPAAFTFSDLLPGAPVERDARLLVVGEYPGKRLTVTEADIDALVANFSEPVPVKVEHIDSPLDPLGHVQRLWRDGAQLMGRVSFPAAMAAFLSARGAEKLSVGLLKEPAWKLLETSLTLRPHVATATLLSEGDPSGLASQPTSPSGRGDGPPAPNSGGVGEEVMAELVQLRAERLEGQIVALKASGRLIPASEPMARALLGLGPGAVVTLSEGGAAEPVGDVFRRFLEAQPPVVQMNELARAGEGGVTLGGAAAAAMEEQEMQGFSDDEKEVLRRLGVDPASVAKTMAQDRKNKKMGVK